MRGRSLAETLKLLDGDTVELTLHNVSSRSREFGAVRGTLNVTELREPERRGHLLHVGSFALSLDKREPLTASYTDGVLQLQMGLVVVYVRPVA
jgi:hypothetical protein